MQARNSIELCWKKSRIVMNSVRQKTAGDAVGVPLWVLLLEEDLLFLCALLL
jgi:hypothetical protein